MNRQFGALSGLAILAIILNHSIELIRSTPEYLGGLSKSSLDHNLLTILQSPGIFGVPIFLFISGSFVAYASNGDPPNLSYKFLLSSLKHILIPYLIWSILYYVYYYIFHNQGSSVLVYIKNLFVGYPFHFIPLLIFFYLISPLLVRFGKSHGIILVTIVAVYQIFLLNTYDPAILGLKFPSWTNYLALPVLRYTMSEWGLFFPLGLVYGLNTKVWLPKLLHLKWIILLLTVVLYVLAVLSEIFKVIRFPISHVISVVGLILLIPGIKRNAIPFVRFFEKVGKRSYGLYLVHLLVIDVVLLLVHSSASWFYQYIFVILILVYTFALFIPLVLMDLMSRGPAKQYHRLVFG